MRYLTLLALFAGLFLVGCGGDAVTGQLSKFSEKNIQKATLCYTVFVSLNGYKGPDSLDELKKFIESSDEAQKRLTGMGLDISKIDDYMNGRDGEPLEFRWGLTTTPTGGAYPVCFEATGVDGTRQCGIAGSSTVHEFTTDEEYEELKKGNYSADAVYDPSTE